MLNQSRMGRPLAPHRGRLAPHCRPLAGAVCKVEAFVEKVVMKPGQHVEIEWIFKR